MIRVTVELVPFGREEYKKTISTVTIGNNVQRSKETKGQRGSYYLKHTNAETKEEREEFLPDQDRMRPVEVLVIAALNKLGFKV